MIDSSKVPASMATAKQWHIWRMEEGRKIPYQLNGSRAKSNDPSTWSSLEGCLNFLACTTGFNLAFTLGNGGFVGMDFDDAFVAEGRLRKWAKEIYDEIKDSAYVELSPSGTGFKAVILGEKPQWARCQESMGEGKQALEVYGHNRFWAFTGEVISDNLDSDVDGQDSINRVCAAYLGQRVEEAPAPVVQSSPSSQSSSLFSQDETVNYRAQKYLDAIPTPGPGMRNRAVFSAAGNLLGMGLSVEQVIVHISAWNASFATPLSQAEINTTVMSSSRNGTQRASKGANREYQREPLPNISLDGMPVLKLEEEVSDVNTDAPAVYDSASPSEQIPEELMRDNGFIGEFMQIVENSQREIQPELSFAAALQACSMVLSRKYIDDSSFETTPNIYSVSLARSGTGKDTPRQAVNRFLDAVGMGDRRGPETIDSGAGIATAMIKQPTMSMLLDECGTLFRNLGDPRCPTHLRKAGALLKSAFSSANATNFRPRALSNGEHGQNDPVDYPHLHIMGSATPGQVLESINDEQIEGGLIGRFMVFVGKIDAEMHRPKSAPNPTYRAVQWADAWKGEKSSTSVPLDLSGEVSDVRLVSIKRTAEATKRLETHYDEIFRRGASDYKNGASMVHQAVWNRASEKTAKLALLFAASRCLGPGKCRIELQDADRAIAVNNWITNRVIRMYEGRVSSEYSKKRQEFLDLMKTSTTYTTEAKLHQLARSFEPRLRKQILDDLIAAKEVTASTLNNKIVYSVGAV